MPLPETIPVRFTEEEAEYVSIRPVRRQTFKLRELVDMVLSVTGRDVPRVQQILRTGTVVFHFYRYWWQGFETDATEISAVIAEFPSDDPSRTFSANECSVIVLESAVKGRAAIDVNKNRCGSQIIFRIAEFVGMFVGAGWACAGNKIWRIFLLRAARICIELN